MEIRTGDRVRCNGRIYEVWGIDPDNGIQIGGVEFVNPSAIQEVIKRDNFNDELTPGPWVWQFMGNAGNYYLVGNAGRGPTIKNGPNSLDGKLMEAAPDLLAACEALLATVQQKAATGACVHDALYGDTWEGKCEQLRAAIAKAKGE